MPFTCPRSVFIACLATLLAATAFAQEATLGGTVVDSTTLVLPGVTVTATHLATGNTFLGVTDATGTFRIPVRTGGFTVLFEMPGFTPVSRTADLLVGQAVNLMIEMHPEALVEAVLVTGEAPLIDTTSSALGSNIDPRQMSELPLNGRNFVDLTLLAKGSRNNASTDELGGRGTFH